MLNYGGNIQMPSFNFYDISSGAGPVGAAGRSYMYPQHPGVGISEYLPGVQISSLSPTQLLNEINRAFISTIPPEYSSQVVAGGGFAGFGGKGDTAGNYSYLGGGLASLITPTGGMAIGGTKNELGSYFAGMTMVAWPVYDAIGSVMTASNAADKINGIDTALIGYQQLDDQSRRLLAKTIATSWDPENPSNVLITLNKEWTSPDDKSWMQARYFLVNKEGRIFDLKGGTSDFTDMLNYIAGYGDKNFGTPTTYAWNYEPTIAKGGGALAVDIGPTAEMLSFQVMPFLTQKGEPQPMLMQWTPAFAVTVERTPATTDIHEFSFPGKYMKITPTGMTGEQEFLVQGGNWMMRRVKGKEAWELNIGGEFAQTPSGPAGKAGFFFKWQEPKASAGGGIYYEAQKANIETVAMLQQSKASEMKQQADDMQKYIEGLHRVAFTLYGSEEVANQVLLGGLAHIVPQFKSTAEGTDFDNMFYRFIGFYKGLESLGKFDVKRSQGLDAMMTEYNSTLSRATSDPRNADNYVNEFKNKYAQILRDVFDNYSLGVQVTKNFSLEFGMYSKEKEGDWTSQFTDARTLQSVYARALYDWNTGFARAFASIPVWDAAVTESGLQTAGVAGAGFGIDMFKGLWMQRAAFDLGLLLALEETSPGTGADIVAATSRSGARIASAKKGAFAQGMVQLFSNIAEDTGKYREIEKDYKRYVEFLEKNRQGYLPKDVRDYVVKKLPAGTITGETLKKLKDGENIEPTADQKDLMLRALWDWFYDQKADLQTKFDGHTRVYLGGTAFMFGMTDKVMWDIGTYVERVDKIRVYVIAAKREQKEIYAGTDFHIANKTLGSAVVGVIPETGQYGAGLSVQYKVPFGTVGALGYGKSEKIPAFAHPAYVPYNATGLPEFGGFIFFTIGDRPPNTMQLLQPIPLHTP
jgi:hypothetical protein